MVKKVINSIILAVIPLLGCQICFGETIVHWKFDEGIGQTIANSEGSPTADLQMGYYLDEESSDPWEPAWDAGLYGSAVHGKKVSDNDDKTTFCLNTLTWTSADAASLVPTGSYTIEMIVNSDGFPADTASSSWQGLLCYMDISSPNRFPYLFRLILRDVGGELHQTVHFYSQNYDGNSRQIFCDLTANNFVMIPGRWYYIAGVYDDVSMSMDIIVRDIGTGTTVTQTGIMMAPISMAATPEPQMKVLTEATTQRSFSGSIDEIKISNGIIEEVDRLYNVAVPSYASGDINQDETVDMIDLVILVENWLQ